MTFPDEYDEFYLRRLRDAFNLVDDALLTPEQVLLGKAREIRNWLIAKENYEHDVLDWLRTENQHKARQMLAETPSYKAAERGWLAMRTITNNLDGVEQFEYLPEILQDRYAVFAAAVLDSEKC
jgi:hypothetical protein